MKYPVVDYKGFQIDRFNTIYKDGRQIFTGSWLYNYDLQEAKDRIDASLNHKLAQLPDKQSALKRMISANDYVERNIERNEEKMNNYFDNQLNLNL